MATGIWPLSPRPVIGKLQPVARKRCDILGTLSNPCTAWGIRNQVRSGVGVLNQMASLSLAPAERKLACHRITGLLQEQEH